MFRECGECAKCCSGDLVGNQYGNEMHPEKSCVFLVENKCCVYKTRPTSCDKYQCAWSQNLFPDWMRPDQCGVLISIENDGGGQILNVIGELSTEVKHEITTFGEVNKCHVKYS